MPPLRVGVDPSDRLSIDGRVGVMVEMELVDRYYWIETPVELGAAGISAFAGHPEGRGAPPGRWVEAERKSLGPDILHVMERA